MPKNKVNNNIVLKSGGGVQNGANGLELSSDVFKFGGTGADGALAITTGTTTIDCAGAAIVTKNYTSVSITGDGKLAFSNPHDNGTIIVIKCQGNVVLTSSATPNIELGLMGGKHGSSGTSTQGNPGLLSITTLGQTCTGGLGSVSTSGSNPSSAKPTLSPLATQTSLQLLSRSIHLGAGAGGGAGARTGNSTPQAGAAGGASVLGDGGGGAPNSNGTAGGTMAGGGGAGGSNGYTEYTFSDGGRGAGALLIECKGALNFTSTIHAKGQRGTDLKTYANAGAGGGGAGGSVVILYNTVTAASGVITNSGGAGGDTVTYVGGAGGASNGGAVLKNEIFN